MSHFTGRLMNSDLHPIKPVAVTNGQIPRKRCKKTILEEYQRQELERLLHYRRNRIVDRKCPHCCEKYEYMTANSFSTHKFHCRKKQEMKLKQTKKLCLKLTLKPGCEQSFTEEEFGNEHSKNCLLAESEALLQEKTKQLELERNALPTSSLERFLQPTDRKCPNCLRTFGYMKSRQFSYHKKLCAKKVLQTSTCKFICSKKQNIKVKKTKIVCLKAGCGRSFTDEKLRNSRTSFQNIRDSISNTIPISFNPFVCLETISNQLLRKYGISDCKSPKAGVSAKPTLPDQGSGVGVSGSTTVFNSRESTKLPEILLCNNTVIPTTSEGSPWKGNLKTYDCCICKKTFRNSKQLCNHRFASHSPKKYKCSLCSQTFRSEKVRNVHHRVCKLKAQLILPGQDSGVIIPSTSTVTGSPLKGNLKPYEYECCICQKTFKNSKQLCNHRFAAHTPKQYKCSLCPQTFRMEKVRNRHHRVCKLKAQLLSDDDGTSILHGVKEEEEHEVMLGPQQIEHSDGMYDYENIKDPLALDSYEINNEDGLNFDTVVIKSEEIIPSASDQLLDFNETLQEQSKLTFKFWSNE